MGHAQLLCLWLLPSTALHFAVPGRSGCGGCSGCIIRRRSPPAAMAAFGAETINVEPGAKCYLVGAVVKRDRYKTLVNSWGIDDSLDELQRLCETAGLEVLGRDYQTLQHPSPSTFIGQGKLDEIAALVKSMRVSTVIFDEELTPAQGRNIQNVLTEACGEQVQVLDRTMLILVIFSQRARTSEAKLQVAAAQMKYMLPRLKFFLTQGAGMDAKGGSGGGQFLKGSGETQLEEDRRLFRKQLGKIEDDLAAVQAQRDMLRAKRREGDRRPVVAIVGYTNAGKSTLLNTLCGSQEVYADDLLFATLDPTSRLHALPGGKEVLLTDTVGFIQKLPTKLVAAFRATLDELVDATLLVHVVDASSEIAVQQVRSVQGIVKELEASGKPQILVLNKADAVGADPTLAARAASTDWLHLDGDVTPCAVLAISARDGRNLDKLRKEIEAVLVRMSIQVECVLPYAEAALLAEVHKTGTISTEEYVDKGTRLVAAVPLSLRNRLEKACVTAATPFSAADVTAKEPVKSHSAP